MNYQGLNLHGQIQILREVICINKYHYLRAGDESGSNKYRRYADM
ncbi:hypothetical protein F385_2453 [Pantoea agglomerans 299R]|nr:hypothetical protein F385_2453 [Pantoea agglomerans 299R]